MKKFAITILLLLVAATAHAAKITEYTEDTSPTTDDLIVTVNDPAGTPANRKVQLGNVMSNLETDPNVDTADEIEAILTNDNMDFGSGTVTSAGFILGNDESLTLGASADWTLNFDDSVDDQLLFETAGTAAVATTDPMFEVLVDTGGAGMTADQEVFGVSKGSQASNTSLLTLDEDGDLTIAGQLTASEYATQSSATPTIEFYDSDATAGDVNVQVQANCTDTGDGTEDCDYTIAQQIGGSMTAFLTADADGSVTVKRLGEQEFCFALENPTDSDDNVPIYFPRKNITITDVYCQVDGGTSVAMVISDGSNALESITCDGDGAEDDGSIANGTFTALERMEIDLDASSGTNTWLNVCVTYNITSN